MHTTLANTNLEKVRQRISEGDCPKTPALSVETLEELVAHFADAAYLTTLSGDSGLVERLRRLADPRNVNAADKTFADIQEAAALFLADVAIATPPASAPGAVREGYAATLTALIRTQLMGVEPDSQDVVLDDDDWSLIVKALSTLDTAPEGWRPIETAPKDGTRFLAIEGTRHFDCWWHDAGYGEAYWQDEADSEPAPLHWQPLPPAPKQGEAT